MISGIINKKETNTILITGTGSGGVGEALLKAYSRSKIKDNLRLFATNIDYHAPLMFSADGFYILPKAVSKDYKEKVKKFIKKNNIDYIIPGSEGELWFFHKNRNDLINITNLLINTSSCVDICFTKKRTYGFLRNNNYSCPNNYEFESVDFSKNSKWVLKPDKGHGSQDIYYINDKEELNIYYDLLKHRGLLKDYIVTEFIKGPEYTSGIMGDYEKNNYEIIIFKRTLRYGASWVVDIYKNEKIANILKEIALKLKSFGPLNIQFKIKNDMPIIIEINPRFSGSSIFRSYYGFNELDMMFDLLRDRDPTWNLANKDDIGVRYYEDFYFNKKLCE